MLYSIVGRVVHGIGLGHQHGMPTANIELAENDIKRGVYAGVVTIDKNHYYCVTNVGPRPSIDNNKKDKVETYILDFNEDIYGKSIQLDLYFYLRGIQKFDGIDEVVTQVSKDIESAKKLLTEAVKLDDYH